MAYAADGLVDLDRVGGVELERDGLGAVGERGMGAGYIEGNASYDEGFG